MSKKDTLRKAAVALGCLVLVVTAVQGNPPRSQPIEIGTQKQLFVDDFIVESMDRAFRILNQPTKHPRNPIIELEPAQTVGGKELVIVSGSVLFDREEGLFKMWYEAADYQWSDNVLGYATSHDGIHWDLPKLGLYEYQGSRDNNIVFQNPRASHLSPGVFKDPVARDSQRRYKMIYTRGPGNEDGIRVAFSPDGIHWTPGPDVPIIAYTDSPVSVMWDPKRKRYVAHTRHRGRQVLQSESEDFVEWTPHGVIMRADEKDPPRSRQFYNMEWMPYEDVYFGFISVYHTLPGMEVKTTRGVAWMDRIDIQLTFSRDGRNWTRAGDREVFIPNGNSPEDFDYGMIYVMQHPIVVGDEIWFYYAGFQGLHWATRRDEPQGGALGLARLRLDGFVSIDAGDGVVTTRVFRMSGNRLVVNADAGLGAVRVEVLDAEGNPVPGFTKEDADPLTGDSVRHTVHWRGNADVAGLKGKPVALRFHIDRSKLYSFVFSER